MNEIFLKERRNRRKNYLRIRLGFFQFLHKPLLNILWILVIALIYIIVKFLYLILIELNNLQSLKIFSEFCFYSLVVILPIIFIVSVFEIVGEFTARKDEADLMEAFKEKQIVNNAPILMNKVIDKKRKTITREFYTIQSLQEWEKNKSNIEDSMNITIIGNFEYGGKSHGRRIVFLSRKGRAKPKRREMIDDEI